MRQSNSTQDNNLHKRASSKDVAREAGVSQSTVSRVFNSSGIPVSEVKKERVLAAAERLGYRPSLIARSLNRQTTKIIGIVIKRFENAFYMRALDLFTRIFQDRGYSVMLFNINDETGVEGNLKTALEYQVAGLVITSANLTSPLVEGCIRFNTPVFLFNRVSEGVNVSSVCNDNFAGGERIAEYLYKLGHRKPVFVSGEKESSTNKDRQEGFLTRLEKLGITRVPIIEGDFYYESGFMAAKKVISQWPDFDAVFCGSDYMAMGFLDYVRKRTDFTIPHDFSLIGFDGIPLVNEEVYPITTYKQPLERMVEKTVTSLLRKIEDATTEPEHYFFSGEIVERGSTAARTTPPM